MKNKILAWVLAAVVLIIIVVVYPTHAAQSIETRLEVIGDITKSVTVNEFYNNDLLDMKHIEYKDEKIDVIDAKELIQILPTIYNENDIYFISYDGFMNKIDEETLSDTYIGYSSKYGWVYESKKHPPNSGIRNIENMLIVKDEDVTDHNYGLNIVNGENAKNTYFSVGELYLEAYTVLPYLDGVANKTTDGVVYEVSVIKQKKVISLDSLIDENYKMMLMMTDQGDYEYLSHDQGYIELVGNELNYIIPESMDVYKGLKGLMINPPTATNMDVYEETIHALKSDTSVLILFMDGLSWEQYNKVKESKDVYFTKFPAKKANTVFKPVTNAGFAAMITGKAPIDNGILDRSFRTLKTPDIFDYGIENDKKVILIEGDISILDTNLKSYNSLGPRYA
jgi:hypothetical protein